MPDTKNRILVVEDQAIVAIDIQSQLESLGYAVDGSEAAARIRGERGIPIVFLTAYVDAATLKRAQQVEPYGYIVKPFSQRDLHTTIQMALYKGQIDRRLRQSHDDLLTIL